MNVDLVTIDIGKRVSGVSLWCSPDLVEAREVHSTGEIHMAEAIVNYTRRWLRHDEVIWVVEAMVDYEARGARKDDLECLRRITERLKGEFAELPGIHRLRRRRAHAWKGGVPKTVTARRVWFALTESERRRVCEEPRSSALLFGRLTKETGDAVGLGLTHLRRLDRGLRSSGRSRRSPR